MTDQINDQISAFIDNELSADESALLVRRFERDPESRTRAMRYTLIGASLRGELLEPASLRAAATRGRGPLRRRCAEQLRNLASVGWTVGHTRCSASG